MHIIHNSKGSKECILKSRFSYSYPLDSQRPSERHPLLTSFCISFQSYVTYIGIFLQINFGFFILAFFIVYILEIASIHIITQRAALFFLSCIVICCMTTLKFIQPRFLLLDIKLFSKFANIAYSEVSLYMLFNSYVNILIG